MYTCVVLIIKTKFNENHILLAEFTPGILSKLWCGVFSAQDTKRRYTFYCARSSLIILSSQRVSIILFQVRGVEVGIVLLVLVVWIGAIILFFNRWGKIRMLLPYQPDYKDTQLKVPGTGACAAASSCQNQGNSTFCCSQVQQLYLNALLYVNLQLLKCLCACELLYKFSVWHCN